MRVRVEDAHHAFTVTDQLAQPAGIERRIVALLGVGLGEKPRQRLGAVDVQLGEAGAWVPEALEVEPIEIPPGLFHELEKLAGVAGRYQLARGADEADVHAP